VPPELPVGLAGDDAAGAEAAGAEAAGEDAAGEDAAGEDAAGEEAAGDDPAGLDAAGLDPIAPDWGEDAAAEPAVIKVKPDRASDQILLPWDPGLAALEPVVPVFDCTVLLDVAGVLPAPPVLAGADAAGLDTAPEVELMTSPVLSSISSQ